MIKIDTSGLDELSRKLEELDGSHEVSTNDLMTDEFIRDETTFTSWDEMLEKGGVKSSEDIQGTAFSEFIGANTKFKDFDELAQAAASNYFAKRLGF